MPEPPEENWLFLGFLECKLEDVFGILGKELCLLVSTLLPLRWEDVPSINVLAWLTFGLEAELLRT